MTPGAGVQMAALVAVLCAPGPVFQGNADDRQSSHGGIVRGPTATGRIALEFTGHEFAEGGAVILDELARRGARASFFLTGDELLR
jgi:endoglucanase